MGAKINDLTGLEFGYLTVVRVFEANGGKTTWICKCRCGNEKIASGVSLRNGHTKSCGCYSKEKNKELFTTHGMKNTRLYSIWRCMKQRCSLVNNKNYENYGGRGIEICSEWLNDFVAFKDWAMENGYSDDLSIDRIDVDGNYEPNNCRWATDCVQSQNQRIRKDNKTGCKGVSYRKDTNKYVVSFQLDKAKHRLGCFDTLEEAIEAKKKFYKEVIKCKK